MSRRTSSVAVIKQDPENEIPRPILAQAIVDISKAFQKLSTSGLNEKAIVCLIHEDCSVGKPDIRAVLASLKILEKAYTK